MQHVSSWLKQRITFAIILFAALLLGIGGGWFSQAHLAYAGSPEAPAWDLQVYKSLSGDGITQDDLDKDHHLSVTVNVRLTDAAKADADKVALFKENFGESSSNVRASDGTITRSGWDTDNPTLIYAHDGTVKVSDKEASAQFVNMHLSIPASHSGTALAPVDLIMEYRITEYDAAGYEVYFNSAQGTVDGSTVTWEKTHDTDMGTLFHSTDQIVVNNHKGAEIKSWKVKKIDATTGEELDGTFEFTMKQRLGSSTYNENFNSIIADSGEEVLLPYPAEYDVRETTPPAGYVPVTGEGFVEAGSDTFKVRIDSEGNLTVEETTGANVTVDADTLTITVPNYKYEDYKGNLAITKQLATSSGGEVPALVDTDNEYTVKLRLRFYNDNAGSNNPFHEGYSVSALWGDKTFGDVTFNDGIAEVKIKDGQTINLTGLPVVKDNAIYFDGTKTTIYDGRVYSDLVVAIAEGDEEHDLYTVSTTGGDDSINRRSYLPDSFLDNPKWTVVDAYAPIELQKTGEVTITNTIPVYDVTISKVDAATSEQIAGASLKVTDREGNVVDEWTSVAGENHVIEGALLANETYTLSEVAPPEGYESAADIEFTVDAEGAILVGGEPVVDGVLVMEDTKLPVTSVSATKIWDDADNQDGVRPESITLNLLADGEQVKTATITEADDWAYTWTDLPQMKDDKEITYTVEESTVEGYTATISGSAAEGFTITNTHEPAPGPEPNDDDNKTDEDTTHTDDGQGGNPAQNDVEPKTPTGPTTPTAAPSSKTRPSSNSAHPSSNRTAAPSSKARPSTTAKTSDSSNSAALMVVLAISLSGLALARTRIRQK